MAEKRNTILVVDDEVEIVKSLSDYFEDEYNVLTATNAEDALQIIGNNKVDIVISDQRMPDTTGVEMFQRVDAEYPHIGKVLLTGYADLEATVDSINKGHVDKYISKPWDAESFANIVVEVLSAKLKRSIAEREIIEEQLFQSAKMSSLGELTAGIIHEINNPLAFISANVGNMTRSMKKMLGLIEFYDGEMPPEKKEIVDKKKEEVNFSYLQARIIEILGKYKVSADRMKRIITDMKTFARRETDKFAEASITEAIDATLTIIAHEYKNRIEIKKEYCLHSLVVCSISKLNQVFVNILVNACHAISDTGVIAIETYQEDDMAVIKINDDGDGIPDSVRDKMFEPFFTTKEAGKGTGLGLSISNKIIEQHHGQILVESSVGKGTTFTIKIPMVQGSGD